MRSCQRFVHIKQQQHDDVFNSFLHHHHNCMSTRRRIAHHHMILSRWWRDDDNNHQSSIIKEKKPFLLLHPTRRKNYRARRQRIRKYFRLLRGWKKHTSIRELQNQVIQIQIDHQIIMMVAMRRAAFGRSLWRGAFARKMKIQNANAIHIQRKGHLSLCQDG